MRRNRLPLALTALAVILAGTVGLLILQVVWSVPPHGGVSIAFNQAAYHPNDTIRFTIHDPKALPPHSRWTLDPQCENPRYRGPIRQEVLRVSLSVKHDVFSLTPDQWRLLHLPPGSHTLCVYSGAGVLAAATFRLVRF